MWSTALRLLQAAEPSSPVDAGATLTAGELRRQLEAMLGQE